jgi:hypothetical protein
VLGASNYTYACATWQQTAADWVGAIIATLEFIGGVPRLLVPDQPRALIANPDAYEPVTARLMQGLAEHYGVAVLPARPGRPQDKAKVEVGVQVVERWVLARLRHQRFHSLPELNRAIQGLLADLNQRPFKRLPGCRASVFAALDAPALKPLPANPMVLAQFKPARVNIDYHVAFEGHYYSVPHQHVGEVVELRVTARRWRCCCAASASPPMCAAPRRAASRRCLSTCRRRTARTCSGRQPSSSPGASASARPPRAWCAGRWSAGRIRSKATEAAWA